MTDFEDPLTRISVLLHTPETETANTSIRLPVNLRDVAQWAVTELHIAPSTTALVTDALRTRLEGVVLQAALNHHYREHPEARPTLAEVAQAAASMDGNPLAQRPDLITEAAEAIVATHPDADAYDVLIWAEALAAAAA